ncbi:hypothetical protein PYW49_14655 [Enterobacter sp. 170198]|uniref:Uncharacterized protein n=1 Tax=Enterobacter chinensis TaxID=3030997 RepID=A0ABU5D4J4_9ENTR|nr:hypothetical protein [Enterobacter sp. 170198]MDY0418892.1 hypothetical protein [Enterobacter sp. 170198]
MATCTDQHRYWVFFEQLPDDQGGIGRHKCCGCAYEKGYRAGIIHGEILNINLDSLHESQAGTVRHKSPHATYAQGYLDGVKASYR